MEDLYHMRSSREEEPKKQTNEDVDALLADVKALLQEEDSFAMDDGPEELDNASEELDTAPDEAEQPEPEEPPLTYYEQSKPAYQRARRTEYERAREQARMERAERQLAFSKQGAARLRQELDEKKSPKPRRSAEEYAEWLYAQGLTEQEQAQRYAQEQSLSEETDRHRARRAKPKRRIGLRIVLVVVLLLAMMVGAFHFVLARQPEAAFALGDRKKGSATILVAGTDEGGYRTDSMLLVNVDRQGKAVSLVSIPRDTLIYCEYSIPKLNSAYGWAGGGEDGMEELLLRVSEITGFMPDGYVVVELEVFEELVDLMGGIRFDVPVDMHYADPTQGLNIDLQAGEQKLTGEQAMQVARFRSGYATADLGRIEVQRALVRAALEQWVSIKGALRLTKAIKLVTEHTNTDLTTANLLWLAESFLLCANEEVNDATLPGYAANFTSGSYYVLEAQGVADMVNQYLNPYSTDVSAAELSIRTG